MNQFEGQDVVRAGLVIPNAGGGLHPAMKVEPREFSAGDEVDAVFHLKTREVRFLRIKDTNTLMRVHVMDVTGATFVEAALVSAPLAEQQQRIEAFEAQAKEHDEVGTGPLPGMGADDDPFGERARVSDGLPSEAELQEHEAAAAAAE